mgnify:CR=1 FL=1|tara:strand:+ start:2912 stop:4477 length:1566 start_codon:yes stop_codon:yes gene_type:complete
MDKLKLYCFFTPSHEEFYTSWLKPTAEKEYLIRPISFDRQLSKSGKYIEIGWRETQYRKVLAWIGAVKENMGDIIVCSDTDVQFLRPSSRFLVDYLHTDDIAFQQNDHENKICSGFIVCRCSLQTQNFFEIVAERLKKIIDKPGGGEQYIMQDLIAEDWLQLNIKILPRDKIWNPGRKYQRLEDLNIPDGIMVHHANWTEGNASKTRQLNYVKKKVFPYETFQGIGTTQAVIEKSKIAICSSSLLRGLHLSTDSIIKSIINTLPCKPDFIGHFPEESETTQNLEYLDLIKEKCNMFDVVFEKDEVDQRYLKYKKNLNPHQRSGIKGNLLQWLSMKKCMLMKQKIEADLKEKYEWVIWLRPDLYYFNSLENLNNLDNSSLYLPAHDNHLGGLMDRFAVSNSELMDARMGAYDYFVEKWYMKYHSDAARAFRAPDGSPQWNPEIVLESLLEESDAPIKKLNICSGKIRDNNFVTIPFWHELYGSSFSGMQCEHDIVNPEVLRKIHAYENTRCQKGDPWFEVQV